MRIIILLVLLATMLSGCFVGNQPLLPSTGDVPNSRVSTDNHWLWGFWQLFIPEDRSTVEILPVRFSNFHFCVTKFMETSPCGDCISIGSPAIQPDGSLKYDVTLRHPFPYKPKYTGYDVRGMVYFPPTQIHSSPIPYEIGNFAGGGIPDPPFPACKMPVILSREKDGGGELINADGYSCYMIPGVTYSDKWPVFSYQPPNNGIEPTPQTTVTPYKLFNSEEKRRAFYVNDEITREYHITLPEGSFTFGYAVDASWWPPSKTPVTNPIDDFPLEANAEDPWKVEFEQLLPLCEENVNKDVFKVTIHHRGTFNGWHMRLFSWDMFSMPYDYWQYDSGPSVEVDEFAEEIYCPLYDFWWAYAMNNGLEPGEYWGVLFVDHSMDGQEPKNTMLRFILTPALVKVVVSE